MSRDVRLGFALLAAEMEGLDTVAEAEFRSRSDTARWALKIGLDYIRQRRGESWWNEWQSGSRPTLAEPEPECGRLLPFRRDLPA
jgi:hypothetical protein